MRRYWVVDSETGKEVVGVYFSSEGKAEAVVETLADETGRDEYEVSLSPS